MFDRRKGLAHRALSGIDLLIDLATLGEYGLEPLPAAGPCERSGGTDRSDPAGGWEAFTRARRGACRPRRAVAAQG